MLLQFLIFNFIRFLFFSPYDHNLLSLPPSGNHGRDHLVHPARALHFLVGVRGKSETMAIGGPWSPSLDGEDPDGDPSVLVNTAVRTVKALAGVDLSGCTQWQKFLEIHYR